MATKGVNFDHFILTPFNLATSWKKAVYEDDEWMERRIEIFKNFTLPSIIGQKDQDFKWIVVFDYRTPQEWKDEILKLDHKVIPLWLKKDTTMWSRIITHYQTKPIIITTRLDNDDAIHEDFVQILHDKFNPLNKGYINFLHGLITDGKNVYAHDHKSNAFTSLKTNLPNKHIRMMKHNHVCHQENFHQVRDQKPLWCIYVHGDNVGNQIPINAQRVQMRDLDGFNVGGIP